MRISNKQAKEKLKDAEERFQNAIKLVEGGKGAHLYTRLGKAYEVWLLADDISVKEHRWFGQPCWYQFPITAIRKIVIWKERRNLQGRIEFSTPDTLYGNLVVSFEKCDAYRMHDVVRNIEPLMAKAGAGSCVIEGEWYLKDAIVAPGKGLSWKAIAIGVFAFLVGAAGTYLFLAQNILPSAIQGGLMLPMFQIFSLLVILGGSVGAVAYALMRQDILTFAKQTAREQVESEVNSAREAVLGELHKEIKYRSLMFEIRALQGVSRSYHVIYEEDFQRVRCGNSVKNVDAVLRDITTAKALVSVMQSTVEKSPLQLELQMDSDDELFRVRASMLNHEVYHRTAELIVRWKGDSLPHDSMGQAGEIIRRADQLSPISDDKRVGAAWFDFKETAGTCKTLLGQFLQDTSIEEAGKEELRRVIKGKGAPWTTPPPYEWCRERWLEHNTIFNLEIEEPTA